MGPGLHLCAVWLLLVLATEQTAGALDPHRAIADYVHRVWQTPDGLPQNSVHAMLQTADGYIWIGTQDGLVRFDGDRFTVFDSRNTPALRDSFIMGLCEDHAHVLWIGTNTGGLVKYQDGRFSRFEYAPRPLLEVRSPAEDKAGNLWVPTKSGLYRVHGEQVKVYTTEDGLPDDLVTGVYPDGDGTIWASTRVGVAHLRASRIEIFGMKDGLWDDLVYVVKRDRLGRLWAGTNSGLNYLDNGRWVRHKTQSSPLEPAVRAILEDRDRNLWLATGRGLCRFSEGHFQFYTSGEGLSGDLLRTLLEDSEGDLWVGTAAAGLNRFKNSRFWNFPEGRSEDNRSVWSIAQDRQGVMWFGTNSGLCRLLDNESVLTYRSRDGLPSDVVVSTYVDSKGQLWAGTSGGLCRFDHGHFTNFTTRDGLPNNNVYSFASEPRGGFLASLSHGGVVWFQETGVRQLPGLEPLAHKSVFHILRDHTGSLWMGTELGLYRLERGKLTEYTVAEGLPSNGISALLEDAAGKIWIGTYAGLSRYQNGSFIKYPAQSGMYDYRVHAILDDGNGYLWLSSNRGVYRVSQRELNDYADTGRGNIAPILLGRADGMRSEECNGAYNAAFRTPDGRLWFSTTKGVSVIAPGNLQKNTQTPPVAIEHVLVEEKEIDARRAAQLHADEQRVEFQFAALSFASPEKVHFRYILEGFDRSWTDAGVRRSALYSRVPAGKYRFRVKASSDDGVWNDSDASFSFERLAPIYQMPAFYAILAAGIIGLSVLAYRHRVEILRRQFGAVSAERIRIAREIHDTLLQDLTGSILRLDVISRRLPATEQSALDEVLNQLDQSAQETRRSLMDIRLTAPDTSSLLDDLAAFAHHQTDGTEIRVTTKLGGIPVVLPAAISQELFRIGQEAIRNAARHSGTTEIEVVVAYHVRSVRLSISDAGSGFVPEDRSNRWGLAGMRERTERLGGKFTLKSQAGEGTQITVDVPLV